MTDTNDNIVIRFADGTGASSSVNTTAFGGGISEPYQRAGCGVGRGWQNEFELVRIRLADFLNEASGLDLSDVQSVRFDFGASFGSPEGKLGLDDVMVVSE